MSRTIPMVTILNQIRHLSIVLLHRCGNSRCGLDCVSIELEIKLLSISVPPEWLMLGIKTFVESSSIPLSINWSTTCQAEIDGNSWIHSIVMSFTQQAVLSAIDVIFNVSDQTSRWIGISFLSSLEVAEMFSRILRYQRRCFREKLFKQQFWCFVAESIVETKRQIIVILVLHTRCDHWYRLYLYVSGDSIIHLIIRMSCNAIVPNEVVEEKIRFKWRCQNRS